MIYIILGLTIGILLGIVFPNDIPKVYAPLLSIAIMASMDSVLGAICAFHKKLYNVKIFLSGFFLNSFVAMLLCYIGMKLGIDLYFVGILVFGFRIFKNIGEIRRYYINLLESKK